MSATSSTITTEQIDSQAFLDWLNEQEEKGIRTLGNPKSRISCPLASFFADRGLRGVTIGFSSLSYRSEQTQEGRTAVTLPRWACLFQVNAYRLGGGSISVSDARACLFAALSEVEQS